MENLDFTQNTTGTFSNTIPAFEDQSEHKNPFHINFHLGAQSLKPVMHHLTDALNEGLKQNLLGNDINMEFLMLSIRSYSSRLVNTLSHTCNEKKR